MRPVNDPQTTHAPRRLVVWAGMFAIGLLALISSDFVRYALDLGWQGLTRDLSGKSRLYRADAPVATTAVFAHMIVGAVVTALVPLQLAGPVRRRWPWLHRWSGRVLAVCAVATGLAGLVYIAAKGTVGGLNMSLSFALYGTLLIGAALQAVRYARARQVGRHRRWATRLAVLALGSWIYRIHYALWFMATGGAGVRDDFTGGFDVVNIWAFYLPYLLVLELVLRSQTRPAQARDA